MNDPGIVLYPTGTLRSLIEKLYNDDSISSGRKEQELLMLQRELKPLLGLVSNYLASTQKLMEAESIRLGHAGLEARENATIREEMLRQGKATEAQMDEVGYVSHETLDKADASKQEAESDQAE